MFYETTSSDFQHSDNNNVVQSVSATPSQSYHKSVCGSILQPLPTNSPSEIFSYLRHGKFDAFCRSLDIYYKDIIQMKNDHGQTVLHILTIHAYPYQWVRLLLMRGCDPCSQDKDGYTAAHYAVERNDIEMLKALTTRFSFQIKLFSEQQINTIHERCLKALSIRENQGLTVFMLACHHESLKCLNYLHELDINDVHLQDNCGDTCLHYAVARRNEILVEKLINQCNANVNCGENTRPSVLDIVQFNREQQKIFDKTKDDKIEKILLLHNPLNRCKIQRIINKCNILNNNDETNVTNLACLSVDILTKSRIELAKTYAQQALLLENNGNINGAQKYYKLAMNSISNDILDWAIYAFHLALLHMILGENELAFELLQQALIIRKRYEHESIEINRIQRAIDNIQNISVDLK